MQRNAQKSRKKQTGAKSYTGKLPKQGMILSEREEWQVGKEIERESGIEDRENEKRS